MMKAALVSAAVMALSTAALADETSTTTVSTAAPSLTDKIQLSYWGNWHGPSIGEPNSYIPFSDHPNGEAVNRANSTDVLYGENVFTLGYKFTPERIAAFNFDVATYVAQGKSSKLLNSYASLRDKKMFQTAGINHDMMLRLYVPTGSSAVTGSGAGMIVAPAVVDNATIDVGSWTLGAWSRARYYVATGADSMLWTFDFAPNANWQFSKTVAATLWIDLFQLSQLRRGKVDNLYADVEPGINWDVNQYVSINPYLNIYPNSLTANATSINVLVTAKAF